MDQSLKLSNHIPYSHKTIKEKVAEGMTEPLPTFFTRDLTLGNPQTPAKGNLVNIVAGVRRCGKTYRLYQEMQALLDAGNERQALLYFNFDDERLMPFSSEILNDVIAIYEELYPQAAQGCYLFFDEIQDVPQWGVFLRRLVDTKNTTIYVTGSSSRMLSSEMPTEFRGRAITRELFPLSFREFCRVKGLNITHNNSFTANHKAKLKNLLSEYLTRGGFPAVLNLSSPDAFQVLQGYAGQTVARDIVEREGLTNVRAAQMFARRCIASSARELSINKVANQFKSLGFPVARETLSQLLEYYEESYLVFRLKELSRSLSKNSRSADKIYAVDPGLETAFLPAMSEDLGQRLETAVYNALRRRFGYLRKGSLSRLLITHKGKTHEIDFAAGDILTGEALQLFQVAATIADESTFTREIDALQTAMLQYSASQAWLITLDDELEIELPQIPQGVIHVVPAWQWLLRE